MQQVLYIDILFWMNWMFDGVLLLITGRLAHRRIRYMRIGLAAAAGAAMAVLCEIFCRGALTRTVCGILLPPVCMIPLAFAVKKGAEFLYDLVQLDLAAACMGGILHFLYDNTGFGRFYRLWIQGTGWEAAAIWMLALSMIAAMLMLETVRTYRELSRSRELLCEVRLQCDGREVSLMALWDSGNQLYDPLTHEAVHLVGYDACRRLLPEREAEEIGRLLYGSRQTNPEPDRDPGPDQEPDCGPEPDQKLDHESDYESDYESDHESGHALSHGLHLIPFRTVGNASGVLPVVQVTALKAAGLGEWKRAWIGICRDGLSETERYEMLLHSDLKQAKTK